MRFITRPARLRVRLLSFCFSVVSISAMAAEDELPSLRPPHGELRPSFWEQNGWQVALAAALARWPWPRPPSALTGCGAPNRRLSCHPGLSPAAIWSSFAGAPKMPR
jgi:hypothetical protein